MSDPQTHEHTTGSGGVAVGSTIFRALGTLTSVRVKAGALIGAAGLFVLSVVLAAFGRLQWWSVLVTIAALAGVVVWLRRDAVKNAHAKKRAAGPATVRTTAGARAVAPARQRPHPAPPASAETDEAHPEARRAQTVPRQPAAEVNPTELREESVYDVAAVGDQEHAQREAVAATKAPPAPGSWAPVEVPPPTYTMKARAAERPEPAPAPTVEQAPFCYADVANEDLPFDGLALDQDLEELPSVHRAV